MGMHLIGMHLIGVYLMGVHLMARISWGCITECIRFNVIAAFGGRWPGVGFRNLALGSLLRAVPGFGKRYWQVIFYALSGPGCWMHSPDVGDQHA